MTHMRVTVRIEIKLTDGSTSVVERSVVPRGYGDNARFFGEVAGQAADVARGQVRDAVEKIHGTAPRPATASF